MSIKNTEIDEAMSSLMSQKREEDKDAEKNKPKTSSGKEFIKTPALGLKPKKQSRLPSNKTGRYVYMDKTLCEQIEKQAKREEVSANKVMVTILEKFFTGELKM